MKKKTIIGILCLSILMGSSIMANAANATGTESVSKLGVSDVHSYASGGTGGYAIFSGKCTSGLMDVVAQELRNGRYVMANEFFLNKNLSGTKKTSNTGAKLWRVKLTGITGRGKGSITAQ